MLIDSQLIDSERIGPSSEEYKNFGNTNYFSGNTSYYPGSMGVNMGGSQTGSMNTEQSKISIYALSNYFLLIVILGKSKIIVKKVEPLQPSSVQPSNFQQQQPLSSTMTSGYSLNTTITSEQPLSTTQVQQQQRRSRIIIKAKTDLNGNPI